MAQESRRLSKPVSTPMIPVVEAFTMIEVTRLNGMPMLVNSDLIKIVESSPDTMVTLLNGEKLIIRESSTELLDRILAYRAMLLAAVAEHLHNRPELQRVATVSGLSPECGMELISSASAGASVAQRSGSRLKLESDQQ